MLVMTIKKKTIIFERVGFNLKGRFKEGGTLPQSLLGEFTDENAAKTAVTNYIATLDTKEG